MSGQLHRVHVSVLPTSGGGRWSVGLAVVSLLALVILLAIVTAAQGNGGSPFYNWLLPATVTVAVAGIAGLLAGLLAVLRSHERGLLVILPLVWGLVVTLFIAGEFTNPH